MNKILLIIALIIYTSSHAVAQTWGIATSKNEKLGTAIVFRYVDQFDKNFNRSSQPDRIIIDWHYKGEKGMPSQQEKERMDALEDALAVEIETNGFATLSLVSTGDNLREWIYYSKSEATFLDKLNKILAKNPSFPIDIHTAKDQEWSSYQRFRFELKE